jgi:hypothetical protein
MCVQAAQAEGKNLWRISSTMFTTLCHDTDLKPVGSFASLPSAGDYPSLKAGDQVANELKKIGLAAAATAEAASG